MFCPNVEFNSFLSKSERDVAYGGCARGNDIAEDSPATELKYSGAKDGVSRDHIRWHRRPVDHEHAISAPGEKHRCRSTCHPGSDDDDVVVGFRWKPIADGSRPGLFPGRELRRSHSTSTWTVTEVPLVSMS